MKKLETDQSLLPLDLTILLLLDMVAQMLKREDMSLPMTHKLQQKWRFYTVPGNPADFENEAMEMAAKTWHGEWWKKELLARHNL